MLKPASRSIHMGLSPTKVEARADTNVVQSLHDQYNKMGKEEFDFYTYENAASPPNWKQDSKAQSRNVLTGELPPSSLEP
jgi:hypothetical protein